jgi:hypothetical protein
MEGWRCLERKKVVRKCHLGGQDVLVNSCLFRLATEIEIGQHTPLLQRFNLPIDEIRYLISDPQKLVSSAGGIGENDHEENGGLATPVISQGGYDVDNMPRELPSGSGNRGLEQRLLREARGRYTTPLSCFDTSETV